MLMNVGAAEALKQEEYQVLEVAQLQSLQEGPVLHLPRRGPAAGGRQEPVHLPHPGDTLHPLHHDQPVPVAAPPHVRVNRQLPLPAALRRHLRRSQCHDCRPVPGGRRLESLNTV